MKMGNKGIWVALVMAVLIMATGCSREPESWPETLTDNFDENKMEQAIAEAGTTFDAFMKRFKNPQPGDDGFNVKVRIEDEYGIEHFWVGDLNLDEEPYKGTIGNDAGIVQKVEYGQEYSFRREEISDWMYMSDGKMQGNYTLRVELESMPPAEAEALKKQIGW